MHKANNLIHSFILDYHLIRKISLKMIQSAQNNALSEGYLVYVTEDLLRDGTCLNI